MIILILVWLSKGKMGPAVALNKFFFKLENKEGGVCDKKKYVFDIAPIFISSFFEYCVQYEIKDM